VSKTFRAVILAASRGPNDPMAQAYGVQHKCLLDVAGTPMLLRVFDALQRSEVSRPIVVSIDAPDVLRPLGLASTDVMTLQSENSAPASAIAAIRTIGMYPVLITTGDHALLTPAMVSHMCDSSLNANADFTAGLATAETILAAYPETKRTFFKLGQDRVSGCNLFAVMNKRGLRVLERWQDLERNRKKPWKLAFSFGLVPLLQVLLGRLSLEEAFAVVSQKIGATVRPVLLPFAEAAIDVDKPADKELAETILARRVR
jgi:GTP:adenosylcobinamide-phosphate guanylyltransferase